MGKILEHNRASGKELEHSIIGKIESIMRIGLATLPDEHPDIWIFIQALKKYEGIVDTFMCYYSRGRRKPFFNYCSYPCIWDELYWDMSFTLLNHWALQGSLFFLFLRVAILHWPRDPRVGVTIILEEYYPRVSTTYLTEPSEP